MLVRGPCGLPKKINYKSSNSYEKDISMSFCTVASLRNRLICESLVTLSEVWRKGGPFCLRVHPRVVVSRRDLFPFIYGLVMSLSYSLLFGSSTRVTCQESFTIYRFTLKSPFSQVSVSFRKLKTSLSQLVKSDTEFFRSLETSLLKNTDVYRPTQVCCYLNSHQYVKTQQDPQHLLQRSY